MSAVDIAVLSYHGWDIETARLCGDVAEMRAQGRTALTLGQLEAALSGRARLQAPCFHVTFDDGAEQDADCAAALRAMSCPATFFVPLGRMTSRARARYEAMLAGDLIAVEDHSLNHERAFHSRHVIGFHTAAGTVMTGADAERLQLEAGEPLCAYGSALARRQFTVAASARAVCRRAARSSSEPEGSAGWVEELRAVLVRTGEGFVRFGRLCVAGRYESAAAYRQRLEQTLAAGRDALGAFIGRSPAAFAHPWWEAAPAADRILTALGYRLTFSGLGVCRRLGTWGVPRVFVSNATPRPLDLAAPAARPSMLSRWVADATRRVVFR